MNGTPIHGGSFFLSAKIYDLIMLVGGNKKAAA
jgi:hypothetical protein